MKIWKIAAVAALALSSFAAENVAPTKTELEDMYNKAFREFDANNFPQALKELDAIDAHVLQFRSEEHTSELQSPYDLVCRLLLEKKKKKTRNTNTYKLS